MRPGDQVRVTGVRGTVIATIESTATPAELPDLPAPAPPAKQCAEILQEWDVERVLMLSYDHATMGTVVFAALRVHGHWRDMRGQLLEIEPEQPT